MSYQRYSHEFKKSAVEKLLGRGTRQVSEISQDLGVPTPTLYHWKLNFAKVDDMKKPSRPQDRSSQEKLKAINEFYAAPVEQRGEILRRLGVHKEHIEAWHEQVHKTLTDASLGKHVERTERAKDRRRIKELEKDLTRKDRALAEATALLVLKKKADLIWGIEENA